MKPQWKGRASAGSSDTAVKLQSPFLATLRLYPTPPHRLDFYVSLLCFSFFSDVCRVWISWRPSLEAGGSERQLQKPTSERESDNDSSTHSHTANCAPAAEPRIALALLSAPSMDPIH